MGQIHKTKNTMLIDKKMRMFFTIIFFVFLSVGVFLRLADIYMTQNYELAQGTVTQITTIQKHWGGSRQFPESTRDIQKYKITYLVNGQPNGYLWIDEDTILCYMGEELKIMYKKDNPAEAYVAYCDWLTGTYLPISNKSDGCLYFALWIGLYGITLWIQIKPKTLYLMQLVLSIISFTVGRIFYSNIYMLHREENIMAMMAGILLAVHALLLLRNLAENKKRFISAFLKDEQTRIFVPREKYAEKLWEMTASFGWLEYSGKILDKYYRDLRSVKIE